jgi:hypothetical protein
MESEGTCRENSVRKHSQIVHVLSRLPLTVHFPPGSKNRPAVSGQRTLVSHFENAIALVMLTSDTFSRKSVVQLFEKFREKDQVAWHGASGREFAMSTPLGNGLDSALREKQ